MTISAAIKALRTTFIGAAVVTLLLCQRHVGFMVFFESLGVLVLVANSVWVSVRHPKQRMIQAARVAVWLLSIGMVIAVHMSIAERTKINAQKIVEAVVGYHASRGNYPPDMEAIGFSGSV